MGEKWFQFVKRVKKEQKIDSLKDAMIYASANKCQWKRDGATSEASAPASASASKKTRRGNRKKQRSKTSKRKNCCKKN